VTHYPEYRVVYLEATISARKRSRASGAPALCYPALLLRPQRRTKSSRPWTTQRLCPTPARLG